MNSKLKSTAFVLGLLSASFAIFPSPALAQHSLKAGETSPVAIVRVCGSLETAKAQARLSAQFGGMTFYKTRQFAHPDCKLLPARLHLHDAVDEASIPSFRAWTPVSDPSQTEAETFVFDGTTYVVRSTRQLQRVRYYSVSYQDIKGKWFRAYVEIPERPYFPVTQKEDENRSLGK